MKDILKSCDVKEKKLYRFRKKKEKAAEDSAPLGGGQQCSLVALLGDLPTDLGPPQDPQG